MTLSGKTFFIKETAENSVDLFDNILNGFQQTEEFSCQLIVSKERPCLEEGQWQALLT